MALAASFLVSCSGGGGRTDGDPGGSSGGSQQPAPIAFQGVWRGVIDLGLRDEEVFAEFFAEPNEEGVEGTLSFGVQWFDRHPTLLPEFWVYFIDSYPTLAGKAMFESVYENLEGEEVWVTGLVELVNPDRLEGTINSPAPYWWIPQGRRHYPITLERL